MCISKSILIMKNFTPKEAHMKKILGLSMLATPFVLLFGYVAYRNGLIEMLLFLGGLIAFVAWIAIATYFIEFN